MTRMNWDRVRKESQVKRFGSEWIATGDLGPGIAVEPVRPPKRKAIQRRIPVERMPGCTCKKPIGFTGQHKKNCPLCKNQARGINPHSTSQSAWTSYPQRVKRQLCAIDQFLSSMHAQMNGNGRVVVKEHQENIQKLIQILQDELQTTATGNSEEEEGPLLV